MRHGDFSSPNKASCDLRPSWNATAAFAFTRLLVTTTLNSQPCTWGMNRSSWTGPLRYRRVRVTTRGLLPKRGPLLQHYGHCARLPQSMLDPNNDHPLYRRLVDLLTDHACNLSQYTVDELAYPYPDGPDAFVIQFNKPGDPCQQATRWLDQANPAFGGECPRRHLCGTEEQQLYLERVIAALECGVFS